MNLFSKVNRGSERDKDGGLGGGGILDVQGDGGVPLLDNVGRGVGGQIEEFAWTSYVHDPLDK